jgi:hypothetical protein
VEGELVGKREPEAPVLTVVSSAHARDDNNAFRPLFDRR